MAPWSKHLDETAPCPTIDKNKITLFNMRWCPYAQRAKLVLDAKNIEHDVVNVSIVSKPKWFLERNPTGTVPTIQVGDTMLYGSLIVCDYLDEVYPGRKLNPARAEERAKDKMFVERYGAAGMAIYKMMYFATGQEQKDLMKTFWGHLDLFEAELVKRGTQFLGGQDLPGMIDYMVWTHLERIDVLPTHQDLGWKLEKSRFPKLVDYIEAMKADPAVKGYILSGQEHADYITTVKSDGPTVYDP